MEKRRDLNPLVGGVTGGTPECKDKTDAGQRPRTEKRWDLNPLVGGATGGTPEIKEDAHGD